MPQITVIQRACGPIQKIRTPSAKAAAISTQFKPLPGPGDHSARFSWVRSVGQGSEGGVNKISQVLEGITSCRARPGPNTSNKI